MGNVFLNGLNLNVFCRIIVTEGKRELMNIIFENFKSKLAKNSIPNLTTALNAVVEELGITNELELTVAIVNKRTIKTMNKNTRGLNKVTDVLSYPTLPLTPSNVVELPKLLTKQEFKNDVNPETGNLFLGDVLLCLPVVKKQAKEFGSGFLREICYMTVHGMLHLLGYDHYEPEHKASMREVEEKVLSKIGLPQKEQ